jgi:hypothetical protein
MEQMLNVRIRIQIIYLASEILGQMVGYEISIRFTHVLVLALHIASLEESKTSVSFKQGSKLLKTLFGCACINLNPHVLKWIGIELN